MGAVEAPPDTRLPEPAVRVDPSSSAPRTVGCSRFTGGR